MSTVRASMIMSRESDVEADGHLSRTVDVLDRLLPRTLVPARRWAVASLALYFAYGSCAYALFALDGDLFKWVLAAAAALVAVGLWCLNEAARQIARAWFWFAFGVMPFGIINPFAAINDFGLTPPPVNELIFVWVLPWVIPALFGIHILGKYKAEFK